MSRQLEKNRAAFSTSRSVLFLQSGHVHATNPSAKPDPWLCTSKSLENRTDPMAGYGSTGGLSVSTAQGPFCGFLDHLHVHVQLTEGHHWVQGWWEELARADGLHVRRCVRVTWVVHLPGSPRQSWLVSKFQAVSTSRRWRQREKTLLRTHNGVLNGFSPGQRRPGCLFGNPRV